MKQVFLERLREAYPDRAAKVENAVREMRGGALYEASFGRRMRGAGKRWAAFDDLFAMHVRRLGLDAPAGEGAARATTFRRPDSQMRLF